MGGPPPFKEIKLSPLTDHHTRPDLAGHDTTRARRIDKLIASRGHAAPIGKEERSPKKSPASPTPVQFTMLHKLSPESASPSEEGSPVLGRLEEESDSDDSIFGLLWGNGMESVIQTVEISVLGPQKPER